jgi:hypothetical protein
MSEWESGSDGPVPILTGQPGEEPVCRKKDPAKSSPTELHRVVGPIEPGTVMSKQRARGKAARMAQINIDRTTR